MPLHIGLNELTMHHSISYLSDLTSVVFVAVGLNELTMRHL